MLMPKKVKYRRVHRGNRRGVASGGTKVDFGEYALQALEACWMSNNQIEAARIAMNRKIRRGGKIWIRVSSPTSLLPKSLLKLVWAKVKALPKDGSLSSSRAVSCSRWPASRRNSPRKPCGSPHTSYRLRPSSSRATRPRFRSPLMPFQLEGVGEEATEE